MQSSGDEELRVLAAQERDLLVERANAIASDILDNMIERDEADDRNVVLEIRSGTGGSEAQVVCCQIYLFWKRYLNE